MAEILFDDAEALRQSSQGFGFQDGGEEHLFDDDAAAAQNSLTSEDALGKQEDVDFTNEMRVLMGMPSREQESIGVEAVEKRFPETGVDPDVPTAKNIEREEALTEAARTRELLVKQDPNLNLALKARIATGTTAQRLAETVEFPAMIVAGAIDEITALLGRDTGTSGPYPIQDIVDAFIRFDEVAAAIFPKEDRIPITPADFGIQAFAGGLASGLPISGAILQQGAKTVLGAEQIGRVTRAPELTAAQRASIVSGKTLRTPTDVLAKRQAATTIPTFAQKAAAAPGTVLGADVAFSTAGGLGAAGVIGGMSAATSGGLISQGVGGLMGQVGVGPEAAQAFGGIGQIIGGEIQANRAAEQETLRGIPGPAGLYPAQASRSDVGLR